MPRQSLSPIFIAVGEPKPEKFWLVQALGATAPANRSKAPFHEASPGEIYVDSDVAK